MIISTSKQHVKIGNILQHYYLYIPGKYDINMIRLPMEKIPESELMKEPLIVAGWGANSIEYNKHMKQFSKS